ncbi:hypothetical protein OF83DRAFT_659369 [Amylostereum chailletii]|nr:hypothetical protein OF83DRAFT_659369 [Amylostereum chailletii]
MLSLFLIPSFALLACTFTVVLGQSNQVCDTKSGICLQQVFENNTKLSFGLALPTELKGDGIFGNDFLANITVPLPYGFEGIQSTLSSFHVRGIIPFMGGRLSSNGSYEDFQIVQYSEVSADGQTLLPVGGATITISPLSFWNDDFNVFVFRCQNCTLTAQAPTSGIPKLTAVASQAQPTFAELGATTATLPLAGAVTAPFSVNLSAARSASYNDILQAAGVRG